MLASLSNIVIALIKIIKRYVN